MNKGIERIINTSLEDVTWERVRNAFLGRIKDIPDKIAWSCKNDYTKGNQAKIQLFKNKHAGQRCFIIGNGPSLKSMDLSQTDGEYFLQTHSTNPLLKPETIDLSIETFFRQNAEYDSLISVTPLQKRFFWPDGRPVNHDPDKLIKTQELPFIYEENSCIYIFSRSVFLKRKNRIGAHFMIFSIDRLEAVDIDTEFDFVVAKAMMTKKWRIWL